MSKSLNFLFVLLMVISTSIRVTPGDTEAHHKEYYELLAKTGTIEKHPLTKYIVSIKYKDHETSYAESHLCAGVIITSRAVVTTAHCLLDKNFNELKPDNMFVLSSFTFGSIYDEHLQRHLLQRTFLHKDFDRKTFAHDIAILVIQGSFNFITDQIEQVQIPKKSLPAYDHCFVLGFGVLYFKDAKLTQLVEQKLQIWPQEDCKTYLKQYNIAESGKLCAGDFQNSKDAPCIGLASEPLICDHIAYGISIFNIGCDMTSGFAAVYEDLAYYSDWISSHVEGHVLFSNISLRFLVSKVVLVMCLMPYVFMYN